MASNGILQRKEKYIMLIDVERIKELIGMTERASDYPGYSAFDMDYNRQLKQKLVNIQKEINGK